MATKDPCRVITPVARLSFPALWEPASFKGQEGKFKASFIFPGTEETDIPKELKNAVHAAKIKEWGDDKTKWPKKIVSPFRFGNEDKPDVDGYADSIFITASNKYRPEVVDKNLEPISKESGELEAGHYVRGALRAYAYTEPKCGITFSLENVMKIKDGPTFSGRQKAEDAFADVEVSEDDDTESNESEDDEEDGGF